MTSVSIIAADGTTHVIQAAPGLSLMQSAINAGVRGIVAECGGSAMCATCHVYVEDEWQNALPQIDETEDAMLDATVCERRPNSRLSCQIKVTPELNGLTVRLPERQI